ncbi:MAG: ABC transporter permease, partial [Dehalococcoidia bacterium]
MLHPKKVLTIFWKDFRDAVRDARILMALVVPLGLGIFYNFAFDDSEPTPEATVVYLAPDATAFPSALTRAVGDAVDLTLWQGSSAADIQRQVEDDEADVGVVLPAGFDAAVQRGEQPSLTVFVRESPGLGASYVVASLEEMLRGIAGQQQPALVTIEEVADEPEGIEAVFEELGLRRWMVLSMVVFLVGMVSMFAVPVIL